MRYIFAYGSVPILILGLQTALGVLFPDLVHLPDLILIFCVYSAHYNGRFTGQLIGAYSGLCEDIVSSAPFATHILIRTILCYAFGNTERWQVQDNPITPIVLVILALGIKYLLYLMLGVLFSITNMINLLLSTAVLYEILYTVIATPVLFSLLSLLPRLRSNEYN